MASAFLSAPSFQGLRPLNKATDSEYVSLLKSNDPVGFNIVDVLAWGSIGHIVAYYILATSSNGYDPNFF
nr:chloroplast photosystem I reaction center V [Tanacetum cinerariifolium]